MAGMMDMMAALQQRDADEAMAALGRNFNLPATEEEVPLEEQAQIKGATEMSLQDQVDEAREVRQNDARVCGLGVNKDIRSASVPRLRRRSCPAGSRARSRAMLSTPCG